MSCAPLSLTGENYLVHLSCNSSFVWVVDADGMVFHRIGAAAPKAEQLNPVWLPIDTYSEIIFTKVVNGPVDWMVKALIACCLFCVSVCQHIILCVWWRGGEVCVWCVCVCVCGMGGGGGG